MHDDLFPVSPVVLEVMCPTCWAGPGEECNIAPRHRIAAARKFLTTQPTIVHVGRVNQSALRFNPEEGDEGGL